MPYHIFDTYFDNHNFDTDKFCFSFVDVMRDVTSLSAETKKSRSRIISSIKFWQLFWKKFTQKGKNSDLFTYIIINTMFFD